MDPIEIITLPDDTEALKAIILNYKTEIETYESKIETYKENAETYESSIKKYESQIHGLNYQIKLLKARLFGKKSEKLTAEDILQGRLFDEAEMHYAHEEEPQREEIIRVKGFERRKPGRKGLPDDLPRVEVIHDIPEEEKICACGSALTRIGEETSEKFDIIPAKIQVIKHIRYKYACKNCEGTESEGEGGAVKTATLPPQMIPQGIVTPGLLSYILISKFCDALPFYRQEKMFARIGVELSRATMCNWAILAHERMDRLLELLWENVVCSRHLGIDETTIQVLNEPGRKNTTKSYMWIFRGGTREHPVIIFRYSPTRSSEVIKKYLKDYKGYLQSDGYTGYDVFGRRDGVIHAGCWAHVRRKFVEAAKISKEGLAHSVIDLIRKLYKVEEKAREDNLSPEETVLLRQKNSLPVMESIKKVLDREVHQVAPKSPLGKAIRYTLDDWPKLVVYLSNGIVPIDNNLVENAIRPFVVGRKNWLFSGSPRGAEASAAIYSVIETAKANDLEPYAYLRYLFEKLPLAKNDDEIRVLLPDRIKKTEISSI